MSYIELPHRCCDKGREGEPWLVNDFTADHKVKLQQQEASNPARQPVRRAICPAFLRIRLCLSMDVHCVNQAAA